MCRQRSDQTHAVNTFCRSDGKDEKSEGEGKDGKGENSVESPACMYPVKAEDNIYKQTLFFSCLTGKNERTVVMDKSKGEPVISVKTKSKERVSKHGPQNNLDLFWFGFWSFTLFSPFLQSSKSRDRKSPSKEKKDILSFDQIKEQRERERQRQREREIREVERRRYT